METKPQLTIKSLMNQDNVKQKFQEMLGKKAQGFITSVLQIVASNDLLAKADPMSIYNAAAVAATLDLPINNSLGFAYIVPYNNRQKDGSFKTVAQFQIGYKAYIQLAQRTGLFKTISATAIFDGQIKDNNPLTGIEFDFIQKKSDSIIGYAAYFKLLNGFEKTLYMTVEDLKKHGTKFSQTFKKGSGLWKDDFESMAIKTVIKLLLSKYAPLSIEMQKAVITDQGLINNEDGSDVEYIDHEVVDVDKVEERKLLMVADCKTLSELEALQLNNPEWSIDLFNSRKEQLLNG